MDVLEFISGGSKARIEQVQLSVGHVYVRGMRPTQRAAFLTLLAQASQEKTHVPDNIVAAWGICNADGSRPDLDSEQLLAAMNEKDGDDIRRIAQKVYDLSGFGKPAQEIAEKNSQPAGTPAPAPAGAKSRHDRRTPPVRARRVRRN